MCGRGVSVNVANTVAYFRGVYVLHIQVEQVTFLTIT